MIDFSGLILKNPIVAAPGPGTETFCNIKKCAEAGAGAVILKSVGPDAIVKKKKFAPRRMVLKDGTLYMLSSSQREIMNVENGLNLLEEAKKDVHIPLIASVCGSCNNMAEWHQICMSAADTGADMIQLDLIYSTRQGEHIDEKSFSSIIEFAERIKKSTCKPVMVKLSTNISIETAVKHLKGKDIAVSLLDSIRVGVPLDVTSKNYSRFRGINKHGKCLAAGKILYPLSLLYTQELHKNNVGPICAGGGVFNGNDAAGLLLSGASIVQTATAVCIYGHSIISKIIYELHNMLSNLDDTPRYSVRDIIGFAETEVVEGMIRQKDPKQCASCKEKACKKTIMCDSKNGCEGCGLCIDICPNGNVYFEEKI